MAKDESGLPRLLSLQIDAFNQLVAQQLAVLNGRGAEPLPAEPASEAPAETAAGAAVVSAEPPALLPAGSADPSAQPAEPAPGVPQALPSPSTARAGFWERQGIKPALAPVGQATAAVSAPPAAALPPSLADRPLHFSLYFFGHYEAEFSADKYDLVLAASRYADRHGFSALWFPERHFHPFGGFCPNPSVLAAALARETERIALRAGSVVLPLHHPVRVAEEWSLVDNLSGGRVGLSFASGWHPNDFALKPEAYGTHREAMFTNIETVQKLWRGEPLAVVDGAGKEVQVRIFPQPARRDLPSWVTIVNNADTYRRAGELGAGVLTNLMGQSVERLAECVAIYRQALALAGHGAERGHVTLLLHTFVDRDRERAIAVARQPFYRYLRSSLGLLQNLLASEAKGIDLERLAPDDLEYMLELAYQRYVATSALIGSPESCRETVERLRELGVDEIACLVDFGVETKAVLAALPELDRLRRLATARASRESAPTESPLSFPLTDPQQDLYTLAQLGLAASKAYNEAGVLALDGPLDVAVLTRALQRVIDRHEALRTVLPPGGEAQTVQPPFRLVLAEADATALPPARRSAATHDWLAAKSEQPFDLARLPLLRVSL
ncbi:MAG TPA: MupA/Atu3671 family FMN-dependent luciferase-like monooxygenase, partial [Thermoanaerobaculia bacterium]